jgi:hypothetical protein
MLAYELKKRKKLYRRNQIATVQKKNNCKRKKELKLLLLKV